MSHTPLIFLLAGQSNMYGRGLATDVPEDWPPPPSHVRLYEADGFTPFLSRKDFGPEVGFATEIARHLPDRDIILCKHARGGANLHYDWNPDGISQGPEDTYRGPMYPQLLDVWQHLQDQIDKPELGGILWMQGERDCVIQLMASAYADNLRRFIVRLRQDLAQPDLAHPVLPFLMGRVSPRVLLHQDGRIWHQHRYRQAVRTAQQQVAAALPAVAIVETDDLPQHDHLHYNATGQLLLGQRYATSILRYLQART